MWRLLAVFTFVAALAGIFLVAQRFIPVRYVAPAPVESAPSATTGTEPTLLAVASSTGAVATSTAASATVLSPAETIRRLQDTAAALRDALVNIICITPKGSPFHSISATGVFITDTGYILTSAHVAAYFLLADKGISCSIRTGNPATVAYRAKLAYISMAWVKQHSRLLLEVAPLGTGEYDFGVLAATESATEASFPIQFPHVSLAAGEVSLDIPVVAGSYGAQDLSLKQIQSALAPTIVASSVKRLLTFDTSTVDVFDLGGSAVAQEGSSGGGILSLDKKLIGSITTSTVSGTIVSRSLSAISASYIRRQYRAETSTTFEALLALPPTVATLLFAPKIPALEAQIASSSPNR